MKNKCNILQLKTEFPQKNFEPWTSEGEALLTKYDCDLIAIPNKSGGTEHLIGNKIDANTFVANGNILSVMTYDDDKDELVGELGKLHAFRKEKIVVIGQNGSGAVFSKENMPKILKNLAKVVDD